MRILFRKNDHLKRNSFCTLVGAASSFLLCCFYVSHGVKFTLRFFIILKGTLFKAYIVSNLVSLAHFCTAFP